MRQQNRPGGASWMNRTVMDATGRKVGTVIDVHLDDATREPDWLAVSTGMFGTKVTFVPVAGARLDGEHVTIAYDKDTITDAPRPEPGGALSADERTTLFEYFRRRRTTKQPR